MQNQSLTLLAVDRTPQPRQTSLRHQRKGDLLDARRRHQEPKERS
jgi:hypothetical protein